MKLFLSLIFLLPLSLFAAAEGAAETNWIDLLQKAFNFIVIIAVIIYFAKKPIASALSKSLLKKKEDYDQAIVVEKTAQTDLDSQLKQLQEIDKEIEILRASALENIEKEKKQLIEQTKNQIAKMEKQSDERMQLMLMNAKNEIRDYILDEAFKQSKQTLSKDLKTNNIDTIIKRFPSFSILNK